MAAVATACANLGMDSLAVDGDDIQSVDMHGELATRTGLRFPLSRMTGALVRPEGHLTSMASIQSFQALNAWLELAEATILNRPSAAASNRSKPYQLGLIAGAGFAVPDTLVTNDPERVHAFWDEHGAVVYKSTSGVRSIVAALNPADLERLEDVVTCPTQFQQLIPGTDYRVHVVGERTFACRISSDAVDYRYASWAGGATTIEPTNLDADVAERCVALTRRLGLGLAGIDLRLDPDGVFWCFEVNTSPGFIWFEQQTGLPIARAVAAELGRRT